MKRNILLMIFWGIIATSVFAEKGDKPVKGEDSARPSVLVVGLENENIESNYYLTEDIAKNIHVQTDSLGKTLTEIIMENLQVSQKCDFNVVSVPEQTSDNDLQNLIDTYHASYALLLKKYEVNYKGEPYYTLFHIVNYDLINENAQSISEGRSYFEISELVPVEQMDKEFKKMADKIALQASKAIR